MDIWLAENLSNVHYAKVNNYNCYFLSFAF